MAKRIAESRDPYARSDMKAGRACVAALMKDPKFRAGLENAREKLRAGVEYLCRVQEISAQELSAQFFDPPRSIEEWEHLAHIVEMPLSKIASGDFTAREVHACALAWADRKKIEQKIKLAVSRETGLRAPKGKGGRPRKHDELLEFVDDFKGRNPVATDEMAVKAYNRKFPRRAVNVARLRSARSYRNRSEQSESRGHQKTVEKTR